MDDDEPPLPNTGHRRRKQGEYDFPESGMCWIWKRAGHQYVGVTIRDVSGKQDLCVLSISPVVKAASKSRGRRSCTLLPVEDRDLLRSECTSEVIRFEVLGGSVAQDACMPASPTLKDVESILHIRFAWELPNLHRIQIETPGCTQLVGKLESKQRTSSCGVGTSQSLSESMAMVPTSFDGSLSQIDFLIESIGRVLAELNQKKSLDQLQQLKDLLRVTSFQFKHVCFGFCVRSEHVGWM